MTVRGEDCRSAKLTEKQVINIFTTFDHELKAAARHGVDRSAIHNIRRSNSWTHITDKIQGAPMNTNHNFDDVVTQAQWELDIEFFEKAVAAEKVRLKKKKRWFPWRIRFINLNKR